MTFHATTFVLMNGKAREAIQYYKEVLNAEVIFQQTIGEGPEATNFKEEELDFIAHSVLRMDGSDLMVADMLPGLTFQEGNQVNICLTTENASKSKKIFDGLKENGHVIRELEEIHFSPAYGIVTDKFGVTFQIFTVRERK